MGQPTTDDTKATKALDNLSSVSINTSLKFAADTTLPTYSIGRNVNNMQIRIGANRNFGVVEGSDILFMVGAPTSTDLSDVPLIVEDDGVTINEALLIGQNTNPGLSSRGIGADNTGNLYFKTPTFNGHWYFQNNGGSANRTEFEIFKQAIKIGQDSNTESDPTGNGEIKRVGTTLKAYVGGEVKDFADIGSGSGANAELSNLTDPTELNQGLSFEVGVDTRVDGTVAGVGADTGNSLYINVPSFDDEIRFSTGGTSYVEIHKYGVRLPSVPGAFESGFNTIAGTIWYNSTTGKFRGLEADDTIVDLGGGSGYVEGDSPTFNIGTFTGSLQIGSTNNSTASLTHRGSMLGFFNKSAVGQEQWSSAEDSVEISRTEKLQGSDTLQYTKTVVNGIIDRLDALGLINVVGD